MIYTSYSEGSGKRLNAIIDDDFDATVYPNILYFAYGATAYQDAAVLSRIVSWTQEGESATVTLGNATYGYQSFTFPVYKVTRSVSYDSNISVNADGLNALADKIDSLSLASGDESLRDSLAAYFRGLVDGSSTLADYTAMLAALQSLSVSRTSTVALNEAVNMATQLKEKLILMVDPYNIVLPDTLSVTIGRAMRNGAYVNCRELGCEDCDCDDCSNCDCWCHAYTYTMAVDWSKAAINYDYTMAGTTQYIHNVLVGDRTMGYFTVNAYVEMEERYIKGVEKSEFDIDPYDNAALPGEIGVLYKNNTAGTLSVLANISNALKVTKAMVEDPSSIAYGHPEYVNTNTYFYQGGYYVLTVKVGSRLGGYQEVDMLLNVADRTIKSVSGKTYTQDGLFVQEITPYGASGATATPSGKITVVYDEKDALGNYLTGELNVLWSYANINYHYLGNASDAYVLIGNAQGGYQTIPVHIVVNAMIADKRLEGATANVALDDDGQPFAYNPYVAEGTTPKKVKVYFNGNPNSAIIFDVDPESFRLKSTEMDYTTAYVDASVRVGNNRSGYQWVDVRIPMADTAIKDTLVKTVTVNPYTNPLTWDEQGLLYLGGQPLTVDAHIGQSAELVSLQAVLAEEFSYDYHGKDTVRLAIKLGNELGGYQTTTASGDGIYLFVKVQQELVEQVDVDNYWLDLVVDGRVNPYEMPQVEGESIKATVSGQQLDLTVKAVQYLDTLGNVLDTLGYQGNRNVKVRLLVGNEVGGYQPVIVTSGNRDLVLSLADVRVDMTDPAFTSQLAAWVDPYDYSLPTSVSWGGYDYALSFVKADGTSFGDKDIGYAGGNYQLIARLGNALGGYQEYRYTLHVSQKVIVSTDLGTVTVDPISGQLVLPAGSVHATFLDGQVATFDMAAYTVAIRDAGSKFVFASTRVGGKDGWDLAGVDLDLAGGVYTATAYIGNELGGYQPVAVTVKVESKLIDQSKSLRYVVSRDGNKVNLATLTDSVVGFGEFFLLPKDLWVPMQDGTTLQVSVDWNELSYQEGGVKRTLVGWTMQDLYALGEGTYTVSADVYGQKVSTRIVLTASRVVEGDSFATYYSVKRGSNFALPTTITQQVAVLSDGGTTETVYKTFDVSWNRKVSMSVEDSYTLTATIRGGQVAWTKTVKLVVYTANIVSASGVVDHDDTVTVGTVIDAAYLPEVIVAVMYGTDSYNATLKAAWIPVSKVTRGGVETLYGEQEPNHFGILVTDVGSRYLFEAAIYNKEGEVITNQGEPIRVELTVVDSDESVAGKIAFNTNAQDEDGAEYIRLTYRDYDDFVPYRLLDGGIEIFRVAYIAQDGTEYVQTLSGGVLVGDQAPVDVGEYVLRLYTRFVGSTDTEGKTIDVKYVIEPKDISDRIIIANTNHRYDGFGQEITAYVSGQLANVIVEYLVGGEWTATAPSDVGSYQVKVTISSSNYKGEARAQLDIVEVMYVYFHSVDGTVSSAVSVGDGWFLPNATVTARTIAGEGYSGVWYCVAYVDGVETRKMIRLTSRMSLDNCVFNTETDHYELHLYEARITLSVDTSVDQSTLHAGVLTFRYGKVYGADAYGEGEIDLNLFGKITVQYYRDDVLVRTELSLRDQNSQGDYYLRVQKPYGESLSQGTYRVQMTVEAGNIKVDAEPFTLTVA
jgi:hypothetical protein